MRARTKHLGPCLLLLALAGAASAQVPTDPGGTPAEPKVWDYEGWRVSAAERHVATAYGDGVAFGVAETGTEPPRAPAPGDEDRTVAENHSVSLPGTDVGGMIGVIMEPTLISLTPAVLYLVLGVAFLAGIAVGAAIAKRSASAR